MNRMHLFAPHAARERHNGRRRRANETKQMAVSEPKGIMCNLTPWKAALVGPYVDFVGLGTIMPVLPFFLMDINADIFWLGFILSAQYFGVVVGSIFWGLVADYCGVRKVYLVLLFPLLNKLKL